MNHWIMHFALVLFFSALSHGAEPRKVMSVRELITTTPQSNDDARRSFLQVAQLLPYCKASEDANPVETVQFLSSILKLYAAQGANKGTALSQDVALSNYIQQSLAYMSNLTGRTDPIKSSVANYVRHIVPMARLNSEEIVRTLAALSTNGMIEAADLLEILKEPVEKLSLSNVEHRSALRVLASQGLHKETIQSKCEEGLRSADPTHAIAFIRLFGKEMQPNSGLVYRLALEEIERNLQNHALVPHVTLLALSQMNATTVPDQALRERCVSLLSNQSVVYPIKIAALALATVGSVGPEAIADLADIKNRLFIEAITWRAQHRDARTQSTLKYFDDLFWIAMLPGKISEQPPNVATNISLALIMKRGDDSEIRLDQQQLRALLDWAHWDAPKMPYGIVDESPYLHIRKAALPLEDVGLLDEATDKVIKQANPDLLLALTQSPRLRGGDAILEAGMSAGRHAAIAGIFVNHAQWFAKLYGPERLAKWLVEITEKSDRVGVHLCAAESALLVHLPDVAKKAAEKLAESCKSIDNVTRGGAVFVMRICLVLQHSGLNSAWCASIRASGKSEPAFAACDALIRAATPAMIGGIPPEMVAQALYYPYTTQYFTSVRFWERLNSKTLIQPSLIIPRTYVAMRGSVAHSERAEQGDGILSLFGFIP